MDLKPESHGLWDATAPAPPETSALDREVETTVAIVGGGFTGMSAALHLAEAGISVALVEANEIGFGGSGRNAGLVNPGFWLPLPDMIKALGQDAAERMID
ncbi:MAG: FAD-binding oxidoreductase, partial [Alphaproteobacteria bacterium]|nr:FAD-binding oxidoreductase [Alphaproteobacteria bacterium]